MVVTIVIGDKYVAAWSPSGVLDSQCIINCVPLSSLPSIPYPAVGMSGEEIGWHAHPDAVVRDDLRTQNELAQD